MEETVTIVPIGILIFIFWVITAAARIISDNRVRTRALDSNATPEVIAALLTPRHDRASGALKWGIILTMLAVAFMIVGHLRVYEDNEPLSFGIILLGPGLGLLVYYTIVKRQNER